MANTLKEETTKLILMKAIKSINKLNQQSLDIIENKKMYHTKLIERSSRCTKDPNPLATTMILLNQKYPLAISREGVRKHGIPNNLLVGRTNKNQIEDAHMHDKVLAKIGTIDWWIEHGPEPDEKLKRLADVLFHVQDELARQFYSIEWLHTRVKWGPPMLQRSLVRTNKPIVELPSSLRVSAIKEVFFPEYTIPNPAIPSAAIKELRERMAVILEDNIPLTKPVRIIVNALDPRERYLPILESTSENMIQMKHAIVHNNMALIGIEKLETKSDKNWLKAFHNLVSCIIFEGKVASIPIEELKEICLSSTISGINFMNMLDSVSVSDSLEFLWARALFEKSTTLEHKKGSMIVCPDPREGREVPIYNKRYISRTIKMGNQVVNFRYNDMRGKYVYNGQTLIELVSNFTVVRDLISLLKEIAKHINYRYQDTTETRDKYNDRMIEKFVDRAPHKLLDCSITRFSEIGNLKIGENCGKYRYQPNSEYVTTGCYQVTLDDRLNILLPGTNLKIVVDIGRESLKPFSDEIICKNHRMIRCFNIKETIKEMYYYYLRNITTLMDKISDKDFMWKNMYVNKFLGASARQMSLMARYIIQGLIKNVQTNYHYVCFLYCFCNSDPRNSNYGPLTYCLPDGTTIDFGAERGIFMYSEQHNSYMLYGMKVAKTLRKIGKAELINGVLEGYKMLHPAIEGRPILTVRDLENEVNNLEEGETRNVFIGGVLYTARKDSSISYSTRSTMSRHLEDIVKRVERQGKNIVLGKRWLECEEFDTDHFSPKRKKQKREEEEICITYTDEVVVGEEDLTLDETEGVYDSDSDKFNKNGNL